MRNDDIEQHGCQAVPHTSKQAHEQIRTKVHDIRIIKNKKQYDAAYAAGGYCEYCRNQTLHGRIEIVRHSHSVQPLMQRDQTIKAVSSQQLKMVMQIAVKLHSGPQIDSPPLG